MSKNYNEKTRVQMPAMVHLTRLGYQYVGKMSHVGTEGQSERSSNTKNSKALHEEIDYGINQCGLPIIVVYPDFNSRDDISDNTSIRDEIKVLWDKLPVFRDNMEKVPTIHIAMNKKDIELALKKTGYCVNTKKEIGRYYFTY